MKILLIAGARPNFMKLAPVVFELRKRAFDDLVIVHTGQHYDYEMSRAFFDDLKLPKPDINLGVSSGSHAEQTGKMMMKLENILLKHKPVLVVVFGDVNSTLAASLAASKLQIPIAHVEAGLRSFDKTMPEEINRMVVDTLSDYLFTTCRDANDNLKKEGIPMNRIFFVGNTMIDTLVRQYKKLKQSDILEKLKLKSKTYALLTLHRPSNVDIKENLKEIVSALEGVASRIPVIFPIHPRTKNKLETAKVINKFKQGIPSAKNKGIFLLPPQKYINFLSLQANALFVLTDSGGVQEETTILRVPCLTLRDNTERPVTITEGTNILAGTKKELIIKESLKILNGDFKKGRIPELWDGRAAVRIVKNFERLGFK